MFSFYWFESQRQREIDLTSVDSLPKCQSSQSWNTIQGLPCGGRHQALEPHLLSPRVCISRMLKLGLKPGLKPRHSDTGCRHPWHLNCYTKPSSLIELENSLYILDKSLCQIRYLWILLVSIFWINIKQDSQHNLRSVASFPVFWKRLCGIGIVSQVIMWIYLSVKTFVPGVFFIRKFLTLNSSHRIVQVP